MMGIVLGVDRPLAVVSPPYNHVINKCLLKSSTENGILIVQSLQRGLMMLKHQHNTYPTIKKYINYNLNAQGY